MKKFFSIVAFLVSVLGFSQGQGTIKGKVLDKEMRNEPVLFANVQLKNAEKKTETNFHGNFEFTELETGEYILAVSYAGYENIELPVKVEGDNVTQVNLGMSAKQIDFNVISGSETTSKETKDASTLERLPSK